MRIVSLKPSWPPKDAINVPVTLVRLTVKLGPDGLKTKKELIQGRTAKEMYMLPTIRVHKNDLLKPCRKSFQSLRSLSFDLFCFEMDLKLAHEVARDVLKKQLEHFKGDISVLENFLIPES